MDDVNFSFADVPKKLKSNAPSSRWKSMLNSVAKHVSQVPFLYYSLSFFHWFLFSSAFMAAVISLL